MSNDVSEAHYNTKRYVEEYTGLDEMKANYKNVGWSLGNACPLHCKQCYSRSARKPGLNLNKNLIDRIISQLKRIGVKTVNLGGNEPIYTNGLNPRDSLLPYILDEITKNGMLVGITTSGLTLVQMEKLFPDYIKKINDVDISIDSPYPEEHDNNRNMSGIFKLAMEALAICKKYNIPRTFIMCGMNWNFTQDRINKMIDLAKKHNANFRVNPMKPLELEHMDLILSVKQFYDGLETILKRCVPVDLSDPSWASYASIPPEIVSGCPCGVSSFRIHSITPDGKVPISPCVYMHDYKYGDLATMDIEEILDSPQFKAFRRRKKNPEIIEGCGGCPNIGVCGGGCASRAYLHQLFTKGDESRSLFVKDPYCPKDYYDTEGKKTIKTEVVKSKTALVHEGYLCTGIFCPKN